MPLKLLVLILLGVILTFPGSRGPLPPVSGHFGRDIRPRPGRAPRKNPFQLDKWGFTPHLAKFEWIFKGGAAGARAGAAGIWAYIPPKWPEPGVEGWDFPGRLR